MNLRFWRTRVPSTASEWFARLRAGKPSRKTDTRFQQWLTHAGGNERAYERQELAWEISLELEDDREIQKLIREAETASETEERRFSTWSAPPVRFGFAAAASFFVAFAAAFWWHAKLDNGELYTTGIGEERTVILSDQSQITLNTATRVRVIYTRQLRSVRLEQGEATFKVAHDAKHPFEVTAAGGTARALGTEFNVLQNRQGVTVSVLEGRVEVLPASTGTRSASVRHAVVSSGEEVAYSGGQLAPIRASQSQRISAWHSRRVAFQDVTLEEALAEFNRYTKTRLVLGDSSLRAYRVSGVFRIGETQALLNALKEAFGVRAEQKGSSIVLWPKEHSPSITAFNAAEGDSRAGTE